jgi:small subunit ribosomal protein S4
MNRPRAKARRSRALGIALTPKCVRYLERRPYPPGQHGRRRRSDSDYALRLREKQRLKAQYDLREAQLRRALERARRTSGRTGEALIAELETRLDAVVLRSGLARTIYQARQFVSHGHVALNGARVDRPSHSVRPGDTVSVRERSRAKPPFLAAAAGAQAPATTVPYLAVSLGTLTAQLTRQPERKEIPVVCDEQLVVEHYSR